MNDLRRRNHYDVTDRVFVADPREVHSAIAALLRRQDPAADLEPIDQAFDRFTRIYAGEFEDYLGCETWYHDTQHSLDSALTTARLLDGHERAERPDRRLGMRRCLLGIIIALFHDVGYIRRACDPQSHGAEFTPWHVQRSGEFLARILPELGFTAEAELARELVHFTGYERALDSIDVTAPLDRRLGFIIGSADLIAQMSDRCYLEKCRDCLYAEFELCGLAGEPRADGPQPIFASPRALMKGTPAFIDQTWGDRLEGYFEGVYRYEQTHFGGRSPYVDTIQAHRPRLLCALERDDIYAGLRRRVECVTVGILRRLIGLDPAQAPIVTTPHPHATHT